MALKNAFNGAARKTGRVLGVVVGGLEMATGVATLGLGLPLATMMCLAMPPAALIVFPAVALIGGALTGRGMRHVTGTPSNRKVRKWAKKHQSQFLPEQYAPGAPAAPQQGTPVVKPPEGAPVDVQYKDGHVYVPSKKHSQPGMQ